LQHTACMIPSRCGSDAGDCGGGKRNRAVRAWHGGRGCSNAYIHAGVAAGGDAAAPTYHIRTPTILGAHLQHNFVLQ
jgi:hypothetical protein